MNTDFGAVTGAGAGFRALIFAKATASDWETVQRWAANAGCNPGIGDARLFMTADPGGFRVGRQDGWLVSAVSVLRYSDVYAHLGNLLVAPDARGQGWGRATFAAAMPLAYDRITGVDATPERVDFLGRHGFAPAWRAIRYQGRPTPAPRTDPHVVRLERRRMHLLAPWDAAVFPAPRHALAVSFTATVGRHTLAYQGKTAIQGYGVLRPAHQGIRIGPIYADSEATAAALLGALCDRASQLDADTITVDVPDNNPAALALAEACGLHRAGETVRMYHPGRHEVPAAKSSNTCFALTSLEAG